MCHLIEEGNVFERIVAYKITLHLSRIGTGISENQFGFQTGRTSRDAIDMVANYDQAAVTKDGVALVLLIDIVNAFNSVPRIKILTALSRHSLPLYIIYIMRNCLPKRAITCGSMHVHRTTR